MMAHDHPPLEDDALYHIYNRGINGTNLFYEEKHYRVFLDKYARYIPPAMDTLAYCLLSNHFHLLIRIKPSDMRTQKREQHSLISDHITLDPSRQLSHLFNGYTQTINHQMGRTGALFETPFRRIAIDTPDYLTHVIDYIHKNPQKHGFVEDFRDYPHSSYHAHTSDSHIQLAREEVLDWFGGRDRFISFTSQEMDIIKPFTEDMEGEQPSNPV